MNSDELNALVYCVSIPLYFVIANILLYLLDKYKKRPKNKCVRCKKDTGSKIYRYCRSCSIDRGYF